MKLSNAKPSSVILLASLILNLFYGSITAALPVLEDEPNDLRFQATSLGRGQVGIGTISSGADYDGWLVQSVNAGDLLFALLSSVGDDGDPVLSCFYTGEITDPVTADIFNDDSGPPSNAFRDSVLAGEPMKRSGALVLRADGFGSSTLNPYHLYYTLVGPNEIASEQGVHNTPATAMPINFPAISATWDGADDYYSFHANFGQRIVVLIDQDPERNPSEQKIFTSQIALFSTDGVTEIGVGTYYGGPTYSLGSGLGSLMAPLTGTFFVRINKGTVTPTPEVEGNSYRLVVLVDGAPPLAGACCNGSFCYEDNEPNCRGLFAGAGTECSGDDDGDGVPDDCDNCSAIPNASQDDEDGDYVGSACEPCFEDRLKTDPGQCGCGLTDSDTDQDGTADCNDGCVSDPNKTATGTCGCGVPDVDSNENGVTDCLAGPELSALVTSTLKKIKSSKNHPLGAAKIKDLKKLAAEIDNLASNQGGSIAVPEGVDLLKMVTGFTKAVRKITKSTAENFSQNKKAATSKGNKLLEVL